MASLVGQRTDSVIDFNSSSQQSMGKTDGLGGGLVGRNAGNSAEPQPSDGRSAGKPAEPFEYSGLGHF